MFNFFAKPLKENEIDYLSLLTRMNYFNQDYDFDKQNYVNINYEFKKNMPPDGGLFIIEEQVKNIPNFISELFKGKKHEWIAIVFCKGETACSLWLNKGYKEEVAVFDSDTLISICMENFYDAVMIFHNHPNGVLLCSESDTTTAKQIGKQLNDNLIYFFSFICATGLCNLYFVSFPDIAYPIAKIKQEIIALNTGSRKDIKKLRKYYAHMDLINDNNIVSSLKICFYNYGIDNLPIYNK